jgi:hypothetical protein
MPLVTCVQLEFLGAHESHLHCDFAAGLIVLIVCRTSRLKPQSEVKLAGHRLLCNKHQRKAYVRGLAEIIFELLN